MIEYVEVIPDTSLMQKVSKTGYTFNEIIAEYVDNSIDAMIEDHKLTILADIYQDVVQITDNGKGMNKQQLIDAMTLAKCKKEDKLGLYGFGLKTASISLGKHFEVITKDQKTGTIWHTWWDDGTWGSKWEVPIEQLSETPEGIHEHGTIIRITKLNVKTGNKITALKAELGERFAHYIQTKKVKLLVNGDKCSAQEREFIDDSIKTFEIDFPEGKVHGWVGLLKMSSQRHLYGFRTFRRGRMITQYDKYGFNAHSSHARVFGEIHLDFLPVTVNKRDWERNVPLWDKVEAKVREEIADVVRASRELATKVHVNKEERIKMERFKEGIAQALQSDILKQFIKPEILGRSSKNKPAKKPTSVEVEKRHRPAVPLNPGTVKPTGDGPERKPKSTHFVTRSVVTVRGKQINYEHDWHALGKDGPIYNASYNDEESKLEVYTNIDFPAFRLTNDRSYYSFVHLVDAISHLLVQLSEVSYDKKEEIYTTIMRESSNYIIKTGSAS